MTSEAKAVRRRTQDHEAASYPPSSLRSIFENGVLLSHQDGNKVCSRSVKTPSVCDAKGEMMYIEDYRVAVEFASQGFGLNLTWRTILRVGRALSTA